MSYNLNEQAGDAEFFPFILKGHQYNFRYPTTDEALGLSKMAKPDGTQDTDALIAAIYGFITPAGDGTPPIKEALGSSNVQVLRQFLLMVNTELGLGA